jgi:hypothetical protein
MMGFRADLLSVARSALADAQRCPGTEGDKTHAVALERWIGGDPHGAVLVWDIILRDYPRPFRWRSRSISSPIWPSTGPYG